eukprot:COSAG05_NODE_23787_length_255_cov_1.326923_1_plen_65_part_01
MTYIYDDHHKQQSKHNVSYHQVAQQDCGRRLLLIMVVGWQTHAAKLSNSSSESTSTADALGDTSR